MNFFFSPGPLSQGEGGFRVKNKVAKGTLWEEREGTESFFM